MTDVDELIRASLARRADDIEAAPAYADVVPLARRRARRQRWAVVAVAALTAVALAVPFAVLRETGRPAAAPRVLDPQTTPFSIGSLPAGWASPGSSGDVITSTEVGFSAQVVRGPGGDTVVVYLLAADLYPFVRPANARTARVGDHDALIGTRREVDAVPDAEPSDRVRPVVTWRVDDARWFQVVGTTKTPVDALVGIAAGVAPTVTAIMSPVRVEYVPPGFTVRAVSRGTGSLLIFLTDRPATTRDPREVAIMVEWPFEVPAEASTPNVAVNGHAAWYSTYLPKTDLQSGVRYLIARLTTNLSPTTRLAVQLHGDVTNWLSKDELTRIAAGVRLVADPNKPETWIERPVG